MPAARYKLLGKYRTPTFRYGQRVEDQRRGEVRIVGLSAGRIPWPIGQKRSARALVLYRDLARAVRRESVIAICYWWGVYRTAVCRWRRVLGVPAINEGTHARRVAYSNSKAHRPAIDAMLSAEWNAQRRAKIGIPRRGISRPPHVVAVLRKANANRKILAEQRRKLSETHNRLGTRPPWLNKAWASWEDKALRTLSPDTAAKKTGRTLLAVKSRRRKLGITKGSKHR